MLWKEVKSWAKSKGYKTDRTKAVKSEEDNDSITYHYTWSKIDDDAINGEAASVSKVATAIFNHMTNNEHLEYQQKYIEDQAKQDIVHEKKDGDDPDIQCVTVTLAGLVGSAINGIIAYIAVYFFKPLWERFMKWWNI